MTYEIGGGVGGAAISGLRAREIGDLWKYVVAHVEDADAPAELKQRLRATLPLWNDLQTNAEIHDLTLRMPMGEATLKTLGETIGLSGFTADGAAEIGVKIDQLAFKSPLLPPWAEQLSPASFNFELRVADKGLDEVARLALDDPSFGGKGELSPETQDKIGEVLLAGRPKVDPLARPAHDADARSRLRGRGLGRNGRAERLASSFSADGLDKTIALLAGHRQDPAGFAERGARPHVPQGSGDDRSRRAAGMEGRRDGSRRRLGQRHAVADGQVTTSA